MGVIINMQSVHTTIFRVLSSGWEGSFPSSTMRMLQQTPRNTLKCCPNQFLANKFSKVNYPLYYTMPHASHHVPHPKFFWIKPAGYCDLSYTICIKGSVISCSKCIHLCTLYSHLCNVIILSSSGGWNLFSMRTWFSSKASGSSGSGALDGSGLVFSDGLLESSELYGRLPPICVLSWVWPFSGWEYVLSYGFVDTCT